MKGLVLRKLEATSDYNIYYRKVPIGNEKARLVLAALGIRAGSLSGMQQNANKVGKATMALNNEDMARLTEEVKEVLQGSKLRAVGRQWQLFITPWPQDYKIHSSWPLAFLYLSNFMSFEIHWE